MNILTLIIILAVNVSRAQVHMPAVTENAWLDQYAQSRADYICSSGDFSHARFYADMHYRFQNGFVVTAENLAQGFYGNPQGMNDAFIASPLHRANEISILYQDIGIGKCGDITVVEFGREINVKI